MKIDPTRLKDILNTDKTLLGMEADLVTASAGWRKWLRDRKLKIPVHEAYIAKCMLTIKRIRETILVRRKIIYKLKWDQQVGKPKEVRYRESRIILRKRVLQQRLFRRIKAEAVEEARILWKAQDRL